MEIVKKVQTLEVRMYNGDVFNLRAENATEFAKAVEEKTFICLQGKYVNKRDIKEFEVIEQAESVTHLSKHDQHTLQAKISSYRKNLGKEPSGAHVAHWTNLLASGQPLTIV